MKSNANGKVNYERVVLAEQDDAKTLRHKLLVSLAIGEFLALPMAAIVGCFAPAGAALWLYLGAALYVAGLLVTHAGESTVKTALFVLPVAVFALFSPVGFYRGFLYFANRCIVLFNARFNAFFFLLTVGDCTGLNVLQFLVALLALVLWGIYAALRTKRLWPVTGLCLLAFAFIGLGGLAVSPILCGVLAFAWVYAWGQKTAGSGSIRKNLMLLVPLFTLLAVVVGIATVNMQGADGSVGAMRAGVVRTVNNIRYGDDTLSDGNLLYAANLGNGQSDTLQVSFAGTPQELYLRGFVGGDFDGTAWQVPDGSLYHGDNNGILRWLSQNGLEVPFQYGTYFSYTDSGKNTPVNTITVKNVGAYRKYVYAPYQSLAVSRGGQRVQNDTQLCSTGLFGARNYTLAVAGAGDFRQSVMREALDTNLEGAQSFSEAESVYNAFVKENYLTVPEDERTIIQRVFFGDSSWQGSALSTVTTQVRVILQSLATYAEVATPFDGNTDFVEWFTAGDKEGNSAYYATMAVLAYRCAGIPARYTEGYYYSGTAADRLAAQNGTQATLTDANAHAWAEVYLDGVGWIPVEVTPGFYYAEYTLQQVLGQPESSVNIADGQDEDELQGSTADTLPQVATEETPPEDILTRTVHVLGIVLLVAIILWAVYLLLELQAAVRRRLRRKRVFGASKEKAMRFIFWDIFRIFHAMDLPADESRPYEAEALFDENFDGVEKAEYTHMVDQLEKTVFGEIPPGESEVTAANRFTQRLVEAACAQLTRWQKLRMKYLYAYYV